MNAGPVSLVNAQVLAEEKGMKLGTKTGAPEAGFETSIGVKVDTARGRVRVTGALIGGSHGRVIRIDDYHVDVVPDGWMLVIRNRDVPGGTRPAIRCHRSHDQSCGPRTSVRCRQRPPVSGAVRRGFVRRTRHHRRGSRVPRYA